MNGYPLNPKTTTDLSALAAEINITFPGADAKVRPPKPRHSGPGYIRITGEALMPDGMEISPYIWSDDPQYQGYLHSGFDAWLHARGFFCEIEDPGVVNILDLDAVAIAIEHLQHAWYPPVHASLALNECPF